MLVAGCQPHLFAGMLPFRVMACTSSSLDESLRSALTSAIDDQDWDAATDLSRTIARRAVRCAGKIEPDLQELLETASRTIMTAVFSA
jgi:hypothetical protein